MSEFAAKYFCKERTEHLVDPCGHAACMSDPNVRVDDETLIALATTCSSKQVALHAEMTLRKRYRSHKASRLLSRDQRGAETK